MLQRAKMQIFKLTELTKIFPFKNSDDKESVKFLLLLLSLQVHRDFSHFVT